MSRDLLKYPITYGEACEALQDAQEIYYEKYKEHIGDTGGLALLLIEQFIRNNKDAFEAYTKKGLPTKPSK